MPATAQVLYPSFHITAWPGDEPAKGDYVQLGEDFRQSHEIVGLTAGTLWVKPENCEGEASATREGMQLPSSEIQQAA